MYTDTGAAAAAAAKGARAYTVGEHIVFGAGEYAPRTGTGKRLLAHELTHVAQQTSVGGSPASASHAESEAERNALDIGLGREGRVASSAPEGVPQHEDKPKATLSGERTGTKEGKDRFGFEAEVSVPLIPDLSTKFGFGSIAFLDQLKITGTGGVTGEALGVSAAELEELKLRIALTLARLELKKAKDKAEALRKGQLSLGATLSATDGATFSFDPLDAKRTLGASLTTKFTQTTPSLLPSRHGELTMGSSVTATGSVSRELGDEGKTVPKFETKIGSEAAFKSAPSRALTLGGVLGRESSVTAGVETGASLAVTPEKTGGKLTGGASLGLTGKGQGSERFIKLQLTGTIGVDRENGSATTSSRSVFLGIATGVKF